MPAWAAADQRPGLVGEHLDVVLHGVLAGLRTDGLVQLAEHEALEGVGLQTDGPLAQPCHQLVRAGEEQISGQDRHRVAPHGLGARHPAAFVRVVHHIVVVERGQVGDLDRGGRGDDVRVVAAAEVGGE